MQMKAQMQMLGRVYLVGSGALGSNKTNDYDCNVYLLDGGSSMLLIDCGAGMGAGPIAKTIEELGFQLSDISHILLTHGHADHAGGASKLQQLTGAQLVCSPATARIMREGDEAAIGLPGAREAGIYPEDYKLIPCSPSIEVQEGDRLQVGDLSIEFIETPGHSFDMVCAYCPELKALFSSDTVFEGGRVAVIDTADFSMTDLESSMQKLANLDTAALFPGHMDPVLENARETVLKAAAIFAHGLVPESIV
ncbi:MBL fold metallo-hydrolase [Paenibacillus eucommiae]|uniref:beta-lactamase n=1 Tax=Paenibacillus eucommiae TaxID=1355755 RepID=A0ABS4ILX2_9BACL|nr:MBL fold metallo-hydrolase [Paenibacillus eucommiae]MBP1988557.1 glyoxylase-like metal-dependent hydrolase (beta-lactamase superfamily II) [Paenibacillus eucommiae]